ncbi:MAG: hypothetical protein JXA57_10715 [Armatimonadetes bacterium]|nr:hypothetical protein [Armatimonadota bacterium]
MVTWRLLRDAGISSPPVPVQAVVDHLDLHRSFYDLKDPSFVDRAKHRVRVHGMRIVDIIRRISLQAVLLFDENRIVLDITLPELKRDWPTCHEVVHRVVPWHKAYFMGDTAQTLNPDWHERLEAEANYGASELMFCGPVFGREARDLPPQWSSVEELVKRYGKSKTATLRRFVQHGPDSAMVMLVSTPYWEETPPDQEARSRHCVPSGLFAQRFSRVGPEELVALVDRYSQQRRGGPVADFVCPLEDDNGDAHDFRGESFYNRHYILTLFAEMPNRRSRRIIVPHFAAV